MRQHQESPLGPSTTTSGQVLAAEDGGDVEPPDLPDGLFADDGAREPLSILNEDEENQLIDSKPTGDDECLPQRVLRDPGMPS